MDLRQLEHAVAVAQERSFTRAAERLGMSQPGLSASVRALERDVGAQLFERTTRQVLVTSAGAQLVESALRILGEEADVRRRIGELVGACAGDLAVGVVQTFTALDVPAALARFHADRPQVSVTLREAPTADLLAAVQAGSLDLAFVALDATPLSGNFAAVRSYVEPLSLIAALSHPLAHRSSVRLARLSGEVFVDFHAGQGLQTVVEAVCTGAGLQRRIGFRVSQMDQVLALVGHGLGVAIVPTPIAERSGLACVDLAPDPPTRRLALVSRSGWLTNPAARALLAGLSEHLSTPQDEPGVAGAG